MFFGSQFCIDGNLYDCKVNENGYSVDSMRGINHIMSEKFFKEYFSFDIPFNMELMNNKEFEI